MTTQQIAVLAVLFFAAAVLYSSVGHAGASGYLAAMALVGLAPATMRPTALVLNLLVSTVALVKFYRVGAFSWPLLWPFALGSVPLSFVGGAIHLPGAVYRPVVGGVLLLAAVRLAWPSKKADQVPGAPATTVPLVPAVISGGGIGLLSGLTGTGGGIFLTPLLLFMNWAETRQSAGVSAAFIFVNSLAGLAGNLSSVRGLPAALPLWALTAGVGGLLGSELGSRYLGGVALRRMLAAVLLVAGLKLILT
jgi:uncharacterized membrane protein YfcA